MCSLQVEKIMLNSQSKDNVFEGYNYSSKNHFEGTIIGKEVNVYDYKGKKYFSCEL